MFCHFHHIKCYQHYSFALSLSACLSLCSVGFYRHLEKAMMMSIGSFDGFRQRATEKNWKKEKTVRCACVVRIVYVLRIAAIKITHRFSFRLFFHFFCSRASHFCPSSPSASCHQLFIAWALFSFSIHNWMCDGEMYTNENLLRTFSYWNRVPVCFR